jgi:UDP-N-acetylglucosamine 2-epimerase (non-hydrolysing)
MEERPDLVLVHGDTTTTLVSALTAFYMRIPTGHVEAGLRSGRRWEPFPEEINRVLTDDLVDILFPPTKRAARNLSRLYDERLILTTGNTVVDAVLWMKNNRLQDIELLPGLTDGNFILMTAHRRENWGEPMREIFHAAIDVVKILQVPLVYPVHPNPKVRDLAYEIFGNADESVRALIHLTHPMDYVTFLRHLMGARVVLSDSGGVQEEAPTFGVPVVLLRNVTERPEGVDAGVVMLAGTERERIVELTLKAWEMWPLNVSNPFGDGKASDRITRAVEWFLGFDVRLPEPWG